MPRLRIVKEYRANSKKCGIVETDSLEISRDDAVSFIHSVNGNPRQEFTIIDYSWVLIGEGAEEIIENPTGGYIGRMKDGRPDLV